MIGGGGISGEGGYSVGVWADPRLVQHRRAAAALAQEGLVTILAEPNMQMLGRAGALPLRRRVSLCCVR